MKITQIIEDYQPIEDCTMEDGDLMVYLKEILYTKLHQYERNIILLYAELKSQREVAKQLCVSPATANIKIRQIRNKIIQILKEEYGTNKNCD